MTKQATYDTEENAMNETYEAALRRSKTIAKLRRAGGDWDLRTVYLMEANPEMTYGKARSQAHRELVAEADARWRASAEHKTSASKPTHWGEDPWCLANVGLD